MTSGDIYMLNRIFSTTGTLSGQLYFSLSLFTSWMVSSQVPSSSGRPFHWRQRPWHCSEAMSVWSAHLGAGRIVINKLLFEQIYDKNYINVTAAKSFRDFLYCKMETKKRPTFWVHSSSRPLVQVPALLWVSPFLRERVLHKKESL